MNSTTILYSLLYSLPYLMICLLCLRINIPKPYRSRQFIMPVFAALYSAALMLSMVEIENALRDWIQYNKGVFSLVSDEVEETLMTRLIFIINAGLAFIFLVFKAILLPICDRLWQADDVMENTSSFVYECKHGLMPERYKKYLPK